MENPQQDTCVQSSPKAQTKKKTREPKPGTALSSHDITRKMDLLERFGVAESELEAAVETLNTTLAENWAKVQAALEVYNEVIADANAWQDDIVTEIQDYMDSKSEKWQDSERGQRFAEWRGQYEERFEEIELSQPDEIELNLENMEELFLQRDDDCVAAE